MENLKPNKFNAEHLSRGYGPYATCANVRYLVTSAPVYCQKEFHLFKSLNRYDMATSVK